MSLLYLYLHKSTPTKSNRSSVTTLLDDLMLSQKIEYTIEYIYIVIRGQQPRRLPRQITQIQDTTTCIHLR